MHQTSPESLNNVLLSYKKYIAAFVGRYVNEPTIMVRSFGDAFLLTLNYSIAIGMGAWERTSMCGEHRSFIIVHKRYGHSLGEGYKRIHQIYRFEPSCRHRGRRGTFARKQLFCIAIADSLSSVHQRSWKFDLRLQRPWNRY